MKIVVFWDAMKMEEGRISEMLVNFYQATPHDVSEYSNLHVLFHAKPGAMYSGAPIYCPSV
jgi:sorbitol-specific phosphotransferase system component IIA